MADSPFSPIRDAVSALKYADDPYSPQRYTQRTAQEYLITRCLEPLKHEVSLLMNEITQKFDDDFGRGTFSENQQKAFAQQKIVQDHMRWIADIIHGMFTDTAKQSAIFPNENDKASLSGLLHAIDDFEKTLNKSRSIIHALAIDHRKKPSLKATLKSSIGLFKKPK